MIYCVILAYLSKKTNSPDLVLVREFNSENELETIVNDVSKRKNLDKFDYTYLRLQMWKYNPNTKSSDLILEKEFYKECESNILSFRTFKELREKLISKTRFINRPFLT